MIVVFDWDLSKLYKLFGENETLNCRVSFDDNNIWVKLAAFQTR